MNALGGFNWATREGGRAPYAWRGAGVSWSVSRPVETLGTGQPAIDRPRFSQDRAASSPTAPVSLSLLAHAACLLALVLALPSRMALPDMLGMTGVALVFEPAPAAPPPAVPVAPAATAVAVPTPPEPTFEATPTDVPPPRVAPPPAVDLPVPPPPATVRLATAMAPAPPAPPPVPTATVPPPAPPVHVTRSVPEAPSPPARTPPAKQPVAQRPHTAPATKLASLTPSPLPAASEAQSADADAARPAAAGPLIPPRPVAGMATNRAPAYPEIALRRDQQGRVMLRVSVSADGRPLEVNVAQTSGYPALDAAALAAVRQWRFVPATQAGIPVAAIAEVPVRFRIDN